MIETHSIEIVKSTAPVLQKNSEAIGKRFYQLLFESHPELYNIFNQTNQKRGVQQRALAHSVYICGEHMDHLDAIKPIILRICHKHRAIGIVPEHYPIVGKHLIQAVKDVLGNQVTEEIIQAWEKAYQYIADIFIEIEQELYDQARAQEGGWEGFREFVVVKKVKESDVINSFYLKPADGKAIAQFQPGQYLTLKAKIPGEKYTHIRHYSLSDAPGKDYYRISVKREDARNGNPAGIVSNYLHRNIQEGGILEFSSPAGDFILNTKSMNPVVLISGGVGLTPMISMLNTIIEKQPGRKVTYIHAAINGRHHAMKEHVARLASQNSNIRSYVCYESPTEEDRRTESFDKEGFIDQAWLESILDNTQGEFYLCGPIPFMQVIYRALRQMDIPKERIHYEAFGPMSTLGED
ncbi:flavohemoprotein [Polycladomyces abyssicola]|uniref:Flavohemoprotein n=1 Tax=Polycladomyces abyssicola TaxID=1125966 RepID=A0A8D5UIC5_9BACL|nr:NO-inducible flavohemoprotein [Polycladomyces abyssicola]BCU82749.1 flavohemoprotein [Polycladomyces abyssicola]